MNLKGTDKKVKEIENVISKSDEDISDKVNWSKVWSKKYPVLGSYQKVVNITKYKAKLRDILEELKRDYNYNEVDAVLVLKDILYHEMKR